MLEGIDLRSPNILLSGGAEGADAAFGKAANLAGHQVVHWTFSGHTTRLRKNLYKLEPHHLLEADPYLVRANKSVVRSFPAHGDYTNNLLRRNFYQVKWCESVYAISKFKDDSSMLKVDGGTAWACQMYVDRFLYDQEPMDTCQLYLFDQISDRWYRWMRIWEEISAPPAPIGIYAGIGSRDLGSNGLEAINALYCT